MSPTGALFWALLYGALVLVPLLVLVSGLGISEGAGAGGSTSPWGPASARSP